MDVTAELSPTTLLRKNKFHVLTHLPDHIEMHGIALLFATERYESFNRVFRQCSVHSNRLSPSRDIALTFARFARIRHIVAGGEWLDPVKGTYTPSSHRVRAFCSNPSGSKSAHLSILTASSNEHHKLVGIGTTQRITTNVQYDINSAASGQPWIATLASKYTPKQTETGFNRLESSSCNWTQCRSVVILNSDKVQRDDFIIFVRDRLSGVSENLLGMSALGLIHATGNQPRS